MKNRCGPPQCNGATRPLSRDCCCPSLLQLWQLPPSLLGVGNSPLLNSHHEALGWLLFHNFLTTLKNSNHKTAPRALQKVVLENTSHLLSHPINHFTRRNRLRLLLVTDVPAKVPSRIPSLLCAVPSEGLSHLDKDYCNSDSALPML